MQVLVRAGRERGLIFPLRKPKSMPQTNKQKDVAIIACYS
jgi:hypothetical protein